MDTIYSMYQDALADADECLKRRLDEYNSLELSQAITTLSKITWTAAQLIAERQRILQGGL